MIDFIVHAFRVVIFMQSSEGQQSLVDDYSKNEWINRLNRKTDQDHLLLLRDYSAESNVKAFKFECLNFKFELFFRSVTFNWRLFMLSSYSSLLIHVRRWEHDP